MEDRSLISFSSASKGFLLFAVLMLFIGMIPDAAFAGGIAGGTVPWQTTFDTALDWVLGSLFYIILASTIGLGLALFARMRQGRSTGGLGYWFAGAIVLVFAVPITEAIMAGAVI